ARHGVRARRARLRHVRRRRRPALRSHHGSPQWRPARHGQPADAVRAVPPEPRMTLDYALKYAALGWAVLPLYGLSAGRCTCGDAACKSPGKHPHRDLVPHGVHDASKDADKIRAWFARVPNANVGIATG